MRHPSTSRSDAARESRAILDALRRLVRGLRLYARHCETHLGLSAAQLFALRRLSEGAPMSLRALAGATLTDLSSVSVVADRLRAKGLIRRRRSSEDGRRVELTLTPAGQDLLLRSPDPLQERLVASLGALAAPRRAALLHDLDQLVRGAGLDGERPRLFFEEE
jgi:DNA-binding MarR family transcriptional regulator